MYLAIKIYNKKNIKEELKKQFFSNLFSIFYQIVKDKEGNYVNNNNVNLDSRNFIEKFSSTNYSEKECSNLCFTYQNYFFKFLEQSKENTLILSFF